MAGLLARGKRGCERGLAKLLTWAAEGDEKGRSCWRNDDVVGEEEEESRSGYKYTAPPAPNVHLRTDQTEPNRGGSLLEQARNAASSHLLQLLFARINAGNYIFPPTRTFTGIGGEFEHTSLKGRVDYIFAQGTNRRLNYVNDGIRIQNYWPLPFDCIPRRFHVISGIGQHYDSQIIERLLARRLMQRNLSKRAKGWDSFFL